MTFNYDGTSRPEHALNVALVKAANDVTGGKRLPMPGEFNFILNYLKRTQDTIQRHARILPTHHKAVWGKWKKRRKLAKRERKKTETHGPVQKPRKEHGDAAYRYDEYDEYV